MIAFSAPVMRHLASLIVAAADASQQPSPAAGLSLSEPAQLAFDILIRISPRIDFFAKRRVQFVQQVLEALPSELKIEVAPSGAGAGGGGSAGSLPGVAGSAVAVRLRLATAFAGKTTVEYLHACRSLLPALCMLLTRFDGGNDPTGQTSSSKPFHHSLQRAAGLASPSALSSIPRQTLIYALELMAKLCNNPDNHSFLQQCPPALGTSLVQLLAVNNLRGELVVSEGLALQGDPLGRFRPPGAILLPRSSKLAPGVVSGGGFHTANLTSNNAYSTDYVDLELRDLALDLLALLCKFSRQNALCLIPKGVYHLLRIVQVGYTTYYSVMLIC